MQIDIFGEGLLSLIPQRQPMVMIDRLVFSDETKTESQLYINQDNIFVKNSFFTEGGLLENIAQTAAAGTGYRCRIEKKEPPVGFIGAIKNLKIYFLPDTGNMINTVVTTGYAIMNASVINGAVFSNGELACECEMKIFLHGEQT